MTEKMPESNDSALERAESRYLAIQDEFFVLAEYIRQLEADFKVFKDSSALDEPEKIQAFLTLQNELDQLEVLAALKSEETKLDMAEFVTLLDRTLRAYRGYQHALHNAQKGTSGDHQRQVLTHIEEVEDVIRHLEALVLKHNITLPD